MTDESTHQTTMLAPFAGTPEVRDFLAEHGLDWTAVKTDARIVDGVLIVTRFQLEDGRFCVDPAGNVVVLPEERIPAKRVFVGPHQSGASRG